MAEERLQTGERAEERYFPCSRGYQAKVDDSSGADQCRGSFIFGANVSPDCLSCGNYVHVLSTNTMALRQAAARPRVWAG